MNKTILIAALSSLTLLPSVHAQTAPAAAPSGVLSDLSVNGTMDMESQYIFRGKKITNAAFQPSVNVNWGNLGGGSATAYAWTSQPLSAPAAGIEQNNEIDLGLKYDNTVPGIAALGYEVGVQMYWYQDVENGPVSPDRSYEFHVGVNYDTTDLMNSTGLGKYNLQPSLTYFHDVILDSNTFQLQVASYTFDLSDSVGLKGVSLTPTFTVGTTSLGRVLGDQAGPVNTALGFPGFTHNWRNGYDYWEFDLELDYKPNNSGTTTFFVGGHYAGNDDGTSGGPALFAPNPQPFGSGDNLWFGFGIKFNQ